MKALLLALAAAAAAGLPERASRWACFYGAHLSESAWRSLDLAVVDPDNFTLPASTGPARVAYVSAGEADERRWFWGSVKAKPFLLEANPDWAGAHRVDLRSKEWTSLLLDKVVPAALAKGYEGVMLDTLDVAEFNEPRLPGSMDAAVDLVLELRRRNPGRIILVNNALPLLERIGGAIDGVLVEDLYTRCMPGQQPCGPAPAADTAAKEAALRRFREKTGKPVYVLLYSRLSERDSRWMRRAAARAKRAGFWPYSADPSLERLGTVAP